MEENYGFLFKNISKISGGKYSGVTIDIGPLSVREKQLPKSINEALSISFTELLKEIKIFSGLMSA